jgi:hypothetical protein
MIFVSVKQALFLVNRKLRYKYIFQSSYTRDVYSKYITIIQSVTAYNIVTPTS